MVRPLEAEGEMENALIQQNFFKESLGNSISQGVNENVKREAQNPDLAQRRMQHGSNSH